MDRIKETDKTSRSRKRTQRILCLAAAVCVLSAGYLYFEDTFLTTTTYTIAREDLPQGFDGYTIAQISDYHNAHSVVLNKRLRDAVQAAKPDIIVLTGDLIDRRRPDTETALRLVADLCDTAPIFFVCGNHDALSGEHDLLLKALRDLGVHVLENETYTLTRGADSLCLAGIEDPAKTKEWSRKNEIVHEELTALDLQNGQFTLLLSHRPEMLAAYAEHGVDLALTGHAHGGQIRLPFVGGLYAPGQGTFPQYSCGVYTQDSTQMIVSRGIGNSKFPFRVQNRPELVVVKLQKA